MRRLIAAAATSVLALTAVAAGEGVDEAELPEPIEFTFHMHGDAANTFTDDEVYATSGNQVMDTIAPPERGMEFDSRQLLNAVVSPNTACSDNALFPTWTGYIGNGTVTSDAHLDISVVGGLGGTVEVRVWQDTGGGCNDANVAPHAVAITEIPFGDGHLNVDIPTTGLDPQFEMKIMIVQTAMSPTSQGRLIYDAPDWPATLTFTCQPDALADGETAEDANCLPF